MLGNIAAPQPLAAVTAECGDEFCDSSDFHGDVVGIPLNIFRARDSQGA